MRPLATELAEKEGVGVRALVTELAEDGVGEGEVNAKSVVGERGMELAYRW